MTSLQLTLQNEQQTRALGSLIGQQVPLPLVIGLSGELGAGKTTFSQGLGEGFGVSEAMPSPTFTLINEYHTSRGKLYHLDLYRLSELEELWELGFEEVLTQPDVLILVEWIDRFQSWPPGLPLWRITLAHQPPGRGIQLEFEDPATERLLKEWQTHHA